MHGKTKYVRLFRYKGYQALMCINTFQFINYETNPCSIFCAIYAMNDVFTTLFIRENR